MHPFCRPLFRRRSRHSLSAFMSPNPTTQPPPSPAWQRCPHPSLAPPPSSTPKILSPPPNFFKIFSHNLTSFSSSAAPTSSISPPSILATSPPYAASAPSPGRTQPPSLLLNTAPSTPPPPHQRRKLASHASKTSAINTRPPLRGRKVSSFFLAGGGVSLLLTLTLSHNTSPHAPHTPFMSHTLPTPTQLHKTPKNSTPPSQAPPHTKILLIVSSMIHLSVWERRLLQTRFASPSHTTSAFFLLFLCTQHITHTHALSSTLSPSFAQLSTQAHKHARQTQTLRSSLFLSLSPALPSLPPYPPASPAPMHACW